MSRHRFFVPGLPLATDSVLQLPQETGRQVARVLRSRIGEEITLFDGTGLEWIAEIQSIDRDRVSVIVRNSDDPHREPSLQVTICQALVPAERMEFVIQKGTELGAAKFLPINSERVQVKDANPTERRLDRWRKIAIEAAEQSGRTRVPDVLAVQSIEDCILAMCSEGPMILLWEEEHGLSLRTAVRESLSSGSRHVSVLIGPVGGLSEAEADAARTAGAIVAGAGRRILRAETAPIMALSVLMYEAAELE